MRNTPPLPISGEWRVRVTRSCPKCYMDDTHQDTTCEQCGERLPRFQLAPCEVWRDLEIEIAKTGLEFADNFRAYRYSDGWYVLDFVAAEESGCCGFFTSWTVVNGEKWIIGCNHGH